MTNLQWQIFNDQFFSFPREPREARANGGELPGQFQGRPKAGVFLVGHWAADAERLLAQFTIDHSVSKTKAGVFGGIEAGQGFGGNQRF